MSVLGHLAIAAGVLLAGAAVTSAGPFIGSLLGPVLMVIGWAALEPSRQRARARRRGRRRPGYVHLRL